MFEYFNTMKTYAYDVCSTLGRMASSMLNKGVELKVSGGGACTDGEKTIYLPQAMKRHLAWDEIDFVRYLVHHEYAHIQHSQNKEDMLRQGVSADKLYAHIINCLEDIRIEAIASQEMMMRGVYERGRSIARRMLAKHREKMGEWTINDLLCYLLIERTHFPDMGDESALKATGQDHLLLLDYAFKRAGIFKGVESIDDQPENYPTTSSLIPLADRIYRLLQSLAPEDSPEDLEQECENEQGNGNAGFPTGGEDADMPDLGEAFKAALNDLCVAQDSPAAMCESDQWGGGVVEQAACGLNAGYVENEDGTQTGQKEERISEADIKGKAKGLSFGSKDDRRGRVPDAQSGVHNYRWGLWAAGMAQAVVDKLRGMSRASYSKPKDSGIRVAQRNVPSFLRGLTTSVLRRRHRDRVRGTAVAMLIDDSGSMGYEESQNAWRSASMLCVACERAKIPSLIIRYSNGFMVEKLFNQPVSRVAKRFTAAWGGGTEAFKAIEQGMMHLSMRNESRRVLFFLTDGCTEDCRKLVQQCQNDGIEFVPILFGQSAVHAARRGGNWDMPTTIALPDTSIPLGPILVERLAATL